MRWLVVFLIACGEREKVPEPTVRPVDHDELSPSELVRFKRAPLKPDPTNTFADMPAAAALGKKLFFDPALSGPLLIDSELGKVGERGKVSCHTCHDGPAMDDRGAHLSIGTGRGSRNSPPLVDAAHYTWANWAGRFDSQWSLSLAVIEKPEVMNGSRVDVARLFVEKYRADYETVFGYEPAKAFPVARYPIGARPGDAAWQKMSGDDRSYVDRLYVHAGKAIAAYLRTLEGRDAPFDRLVGGKTDAISAAAKRGFRLFVKHCEVCHAGPQFTDNKFHALAVAQFGDHVPPEDAGRIEDVKALLASPYNADGVFSDHRGTGRLDRIEKAGYGAFRTPTLRNVAVTGPYMHDGLFKTLANVVAFYNAGGGEVEGVTKDPELTRLGLTDREQVDRRIHADTHRRLTTGRDKVTDRASCSRVQRRRGDRSAAHDRLHRRPAAPRGAGADPALPRSPDQAAARPGAADRRGVRAPDVGDRGARGRGDGAG